jgi:hypothetical protein
MQVTSQLRSLRNLYFARTVVQAIWAVTVIGFGVKNPAVGAILLVLYPLWDVACTVYDLRASAGSDSDAGSGASAGMASATTQYVNAAAGVLTAIAIGLTAYAHPQYAVAAFGGWALVAGLLQLVVGVVRRQSLGGQWAMILSGAQSTLAGVAFALGGLADKIHVKDLAGYAVFGAIYFLIGGILLSRKMAAIADGR